MTTPLTITSRRAFTLIEVLITVTIVGLAAAMVVPQMLKSGTLTVQAAARMVIADLLYAQNEAIARQTPRRIVFDASANSYRMTDAHGTTLASTYRGTGSSSSNYVVDFSRDGRFAGVRLENVNLGGDVFIEYDDLGTPSTGGSVDLVANNLRYRATIAPFTGRITVAPVN